MDNNSTISEYLQELASSTSFVGLNVPAPIIIFFTYSLFLHNCSTLVLDFA